MTHPEPVINYLRELSRQAQACRHRYPVVLAGGVDWCRELALAVCHQLEAEQTLWISDPALSLAECVLPVNQTGKVLGREFDRVIFDAHAGFDPDAFGAVSGTIRGGGLLLLLTPPLLQWPEFDDPEHAKLVVSPYQPVDVKGRFLNRLARLIETSADITLICQGEAPPPLPKSVPAVIAPSADDSACRTPDQLAAVEGIIHVVTGHRRRPLVLTSDRGRGKSSALGFAAARLLQKGARRIIVTGPRLAAVAPVFEHAQSLLTAAESASGLIRWSQGCIEFMPPDALIQETPPADLVLVDEAAAIPAPLLECLLAAYSRIVFSTTVHGYEGTGRGFDVRFKRVLDRRTPDWRELRLETPIRWAQGDPLERFVFRALLLDAEVAPVIQAEGKAIVVERLDRDALQRDESLLSELFGLLVTAHYRTRPSDLRSLLDSPNLTLFALRRGRQLLGTAVVAAEGGFSPELAEAVYRGRRRLQGHLLAQSLAAHAGLEQAPCRRLARVMRIAVHPDAQRQGLGSRLLAGISDWAAAEGFDAIGASFGASEDLLTFWGRCSFQPVRLGFRREHSSGEYSALVLKPLSEAGEALFSQARARFSDRFVHELSDPLRELDPRLAATLLGYGEAAAINLSEADRHDIQAFAHDRRGYEVTLLPLWRFCRMAFADGRARELLSEREQILLVARVLQKRSWAEVVKRLGLQGKASALAMMRQAVRRLSMHVAHSSCST